METNMSGRSMMAAECLAALRTFRKAAACRNCERLDWALAQMQMVGDYDLAFTACLSRPEADLVHPAPPCRPCPPAHAVRAWLQPGPLHVP
jgi:hypothetical protein